MTINVHDILKSVYSSDSRSYDLLLRHSEQVTQKALTIAEHLPEMKPDMEFIAQAAMLHDIGIGQTRTPSLGCTGAYPYVCHGVIGRNLLMREGLFRHALVCERHVGVGIHAEEIERLNLPLPVREMVPLTIEEKIICYADKFFSKADNADKKEKKLSKIVNGLRKYGIDKQLRFQSLHAELNSQKAEL